jgi:hypothetical protein
VLNIKVVSLILCVSLLAACAPSQTTIQTAIAKTQAAWTPTSTFTPPPTPTPSPTPIPLSAINLEPILILPGDLPAGYSGAQIGEPPEGYSDIKGYENAIYQQFESNGSSAGGVSIFLYESIDKRDSAYSLITDRFGISSNDSGFTVIVGQLSGVGEKALYVTMETSISFFSIKVADLAFVRCHALVSIRMIDTLNVDYLSAYSIRLDKRLQSIACSP